MHSSRMRTGRSLTVSRSLLPGEGGCLLQGGLCLLPGGLLPGGCLLGGALGFCFWGGVSAPSGGGCLLAGVSAPGGECLLQGDGGFCFLGGWVSASWGDGCLLLGGGVCSWGEVSASGQGVCSRGGWGVCSQGGICSRTLPPVNRITDTSKNIALATTSLRPVKTACIELCGGVHTAQLQRAMEISIGFCTYVTGICIRLGVL